MPKCEQCGKEVLFPFECSYCGKTFCAEHRLPENHQCPNLPKEPFWCQKEKMVEERLVKKKLGMCPECGALSADIIGYDAKTMTFECKECGHKWIQQKAFPHNIIESKDVLESKEKPEHLRTRERTSHTLSRVLIGCIISILGLGIIIWEIHNPLFWTIIFVWFIPIPLVLIGGFLIILGAIVAISSVTTFVVSLATIKKIIAISVIVIIIGIILWNTPSILLAFQKIIGLQPSSTYSHKELVDYALSLINSDRLQHGLSNVSLSSIDSGQQHADRMLISHFFSHWDTNGYKPYMRYTLAGGRGSVAENTAWEYSSGPFDVKESLRDLEWQMMYNDSGSNWGHRDNILNPLHNKVSIGIAYDNNNVYFVQDFENDYIEWSTMSVSNNNEIIMSGTFQHIEVSVDWINIFYDNLPLSLTPKQLENPPYSGGYDMGVFVGMVVPSGYQSPEGITITAQKWVQTGRNFEIRFDLSAAFNSHGEGVYTLYLQPDPDATEDSLTSYSIWYYE